MDHGNRIHETYKGFVRQNIGTLEQFVQTHLGSCTKIVDVLEEYELMSGNTIVGRPDFFITTENPYGVVFVEVKSGIGWHAQRKAGEQFRKWCTVKNGYTILGGVLVQGREPKMQWIYREVNLSSDLITSKGYNRNKVYNHEG
jgi:hypothetical protein